MRAQELLVYIENGALEVCVWGHRLPAQVTSRRNAPLRALHARSQGPVPHSRTFSKHNLLAEPASEATRLLCV
jgi:hypothetical protein